MAFPIGGTGEDHVAIIEMHYDNPDNTEGESSVKESFYACHIVYNTYIGVIDSSGMKFYYTTEEPACWLEVLSLVVEPVPLYISRPENLSSP